MLLAAILVKRHRSREKRNTDSLLCPHPAALRHVCVCVWGGALRCLPPDAHPLVQVTFSSTSGHRVKHSLVGLDLISGHLSSVGRVSPFSLSGNYRN